MDTINGLPLERYGELIAAERELQLLKNALAKTRNYSDIEPLKMHFGIIEEKENATDTEA